MDHVSAIEYFTYGFGSFKHGVHNLRIISIGNLLMSDIIKFFCDYFKFEILFFNVKDSSIISLVTLYNSSNAAISITSIIRSFVDGFCRPTFKYTFL